MTLAPLLNRLETVFIDTAPIIYFIEAHPDFGPLTKQLFERIQSGKLQALSSVITLTEVLPKPVETGNEKLARKFARFLRNGTNFQLVEISADIAERAGRLRGKYPALKTIDAIQLAAAIDAEAQAFITNDKRLSQIRETTVIVLSDYVV
jgi:predicted nucleic acid-binding protein